MLIVALIIQVIMVAVFAAALVDDASDSKPGVRVAMVGFLLLTMIQFGLIWGLR